jgi:hypothetical protein
VPKDEKVEIAADTFYSVSMFPSNCGAVLKNILKKKKSNDTV